MTDDGTSLLATAMAKSNRATSSGFWTRFLSACSAEPGVSDSRLSSSGLLIQMSLVRADVSSVTILVICALPSDLMLDIASMMPLDCRLPLLPEYRPLISSSTTSLRSLSGRMPQVTIHLLPLICCAPPTRPAYDTDLHDLRTPEL